MNRVHGAYAEFVAVQSSQLGPIPDSVSNERAVWAEPLANIVHCFRISMSETPKSMAILGAGTMGALGLTVAKSRKIEKVVAGGKKKAGVKEAEGVGGGGGDKGCEFVFRGGAPGQGIIGVGV